MSWAIALIAPPVLAAEVDDEAEFVALINALRSEEGLAPLAIDTELVVGSRLWANQLSQDGVLSHAPDLTVGVTSEWSKLGENVGVADSDQLEQLFDAFVSSPTHYANLVEASFTHIGTGVVYDDDGRMWTTHRFMAKVEATSTTLPTASSSTTSEATPSSTTTVTTGSTPTTSTSDPPRTSTSSPATSEGETQDEDERPVLQTIPADPVDAELLAFLFAQLARTG